MLTQVDTMKGKLQPSLGKSLLASLVILPLTPFVLLFFMGRIAWDLSRYMQEDFDNWLVRK